MAFWCLGGARLKKKEEEKFSGNWRGSCFLLYLKYKTWGAIKGSRKIYDRMFFLFTVFI